MNNIKLYEEIKKVLQELDLTPRQYEKAIRQIARLLKV